MCSSETSCHMDMLGCVQHSRYTFTLISDFTSPPFPLSCCASLYFFPSFPLDVGWLCLFIYDSWIHCVTKETHVARCKTWTFQRDRSVYHAAYLTGFFFCLTLCKASKCYEDFSVRFERWYYFRTNGFSLEIWFVIVNFNTTTLICSRTTIFLFVLHLKYTNVK